MILGLLGAFMKTAPSPMWPTHFLARSAIRESPAPLGKPSSRNIGGTLQESSAVNTVRRTPVRELLESSGAKRLFSEARVAGKATLACPVFQGSAQAVRCRRSGSRGSQDWGVGTPLTTAADFITSFYPNCRLCVGGFRPAHSHTTRDYTKPFPLVNTPP